MEHAAVRRQRLCETRSQDYIEVLSNNGQLLDLRHLLIDELRGVSAPYSDRAVTCVLESDGKKYLGTNIEQSVRPRFIHAERVALASMQSEKIWQIGRIVMGGLGQSKMKEIAPCYSCFEALKPFLAEDVELVLFEPNDFHQISVVPAPELAHAYEPKPPARITAENDARAIAEELREKTALRGNDLAFMAYLKKNLGDCGLKLYLTGSACGRGGIGQVIEKRKGSYTDLDLVVIAPDPQVGARGGYSQRTKERIEKLFLASVKAADSGSRKLKYRAGSGVAAESILKDRYARIETEIDLTIAPNLYEGMLDKTYYRNNWFVEIA